ncbi:MAG: hypothetical protein V1899_09025 [Planctomycetota bacterium]
MKIYAKFLTVILVGSLILIGCNTIVEKGETRAILKAGQQISEDMVGWVAVPNSTPAIVKKEKGLTYAVIATHQYIPASLNGWVAMTPTLFSEMTGVAVATKEVPASEKWILKPVGKSVPKDKEGWVAMPFTEPKIEATATKQHLKMAKLNTDNVIPKDMNGWVAVDTTVLAKLAKERVEKAGPGAQLPKERN